jgi:hypothetical protein
MHLLRDLFSVCQITTNVVTDISSYPSSTERASLFEETVNELHLYRRIRRPWTEQDKVAVTRLEATALATFSASMALGDTWPLRSVQRQLEDREKGEPFSWRHPDIVNDTTKGCVW